MPGITRLNESCQVAPFVGRSCPARGFQGLPVVAMSEKARVSGSGAQVRTSRWLALWGGGFCGLLISRWRHRRPWSGRIARGSIIGYRIQELAVESFVSGAGCVLASAGDEGGQRSDPA